MEIRIVYYSWKGHTKKIVSELSSRLNSPALEIIPAKPVRIPLAAIKAMLALKTAIQPINVDLATIDGLIVACPVWAGKVPPFIHEYIAHVQNGKGKIFYIVMEMGGRGDTSAISLIRKVLESKGMIFGGSVTTVEKEVDSGEYIQKIIPFVEKIKHS